MKRGICVRVCSIAILAVIIISVLQTFALAAPIQVPQAQPTGPRIWLGERQQLPMQSGGAPGGAALLGGQAALAPAAARLRRRAMRHSRRSGASNSRRHFWRKAPRLRRR